MLKNFIKELIIMLILKKKIFERKKFLIIIDNKIFIDFVNFFGGIKKFRIE